MAVSTFIKRMVLGPTAAKKPKLTERDLIREESAIGAQLFGPVPAGHRREFFCLDEHTWIWYEEWSDQNGQHSLTTRYDIRPNGVLKAQDGQPYQFVKGQELSNLTSAIVRYYQETTRQLYAQPTHA